LGVGGLIGSGRTELMELIFGVQRPKSGAVVFRGQKITPRNPGEAVKEGIALVPEDRKRQGAHMEMRIDENISIAILKSISRRTLVDKKRERGISEQYQKSLRIKTPSLKQKIKNLSGGNQQKVILAKWLATAPELIIFDEPTRGIDVGAKYEIYKLMNELVENKKTIIMISSEMEELIGMSDRIIVLAGGKITGELEKSAFSQEAIMNCASGVGRHARESLTNANNPTSGMDKNGVTAFINSLLKARNDIHFGVVQNMKFSRDTFNEKREDIIYPLMDSYFGRGGTQAMVNVVGKEDLENARLHPEKYSNLIVRVGGFSARYVELADDVQIDILNRTLN
ncbi:MAG: ATP-binding cassette domain-containing protein, partial [Clostridium sp.]|nr:ATP-binding cassette domain-containing protein [Clostridium sp.]